MYCNEDDIKIIIPEAELIQLTDDLNTGEINSEIITSVIKFAETTINGYLNSRYTLPLSDVPELVRNYAVDLAVYRLYQRRMAQSMPESIVNIYKNVVKELEKIQKGIISLSINEQSAEMAKVNDTQACITNKTPADRVFSKELLNGF